MGIDSAHETQRMRRVLAVVRHPLGGVRTHILYTYPHLIRAGYRFTFVLPADEQSKAFRDDIASWEGVETVEVPPRSRWKRTCNFVPAVRRLLRQRRFALIHTHGLGAAAQVVLANVGFGLPHVATSQDVFDHVPVSPIAGRAKMHLLGQVLRRLDVLIAVSEDTREDHLRHLPSLRKGPCRLVTIHNGIDIDTFLRRNGEPAANLRGRLGLGNDVFLMGFLGRFMEQKGFLVLVDALAGLVAQPQPRPFHLVAVGSGDFLERYRAIVASKPEIRGRVSFLPHVPSAAPILRELDLLVMPSLWEAHPLLPMEAMLLGVPVVGTDCLGLREVLRSSPSSMVPKGNAHALSEALREAITTPSRDQAEEYRTTAMQRFDSAATAEALRAVFTEAVRIGWSPFSDCGRSASMKVTPGDFK